MTPLAKRLRACIPEQHTWLSDRAGTTVNYLYALASCHRERISASLAVGIEDATIDLHERGGTPIVAARELATRCALSGLEAQ